MSARSPIPLSERKKSWRQRRIEAGNCGNCGNSRDDIAKTLCDDCLAKRRSHYQANRERIIEGICARQKINRSTLRIYLRDRRRGERRKLIEAMGGKCVRCGFSDHRALQIDHVLGDGYSECVLTKSGYRGRSYSFGDILADKTGRYQLLCANCNWIKRYENGEHAGYEGVRAKREKCAA